MAQTSPEISVTNVTWQILILSWPSFSYLENFSAERICSMPPSHLLVAASHPWCPLACGCISPASAPIPLVAAIPVSVSHFPLLSLIRTPALRSL